MSLLPRSVGGQLLALLLLALVVTQGLSLVLLTDERNRAVRAAIGLEAAGRAANVALLLEEAPEGSARLNPSIRGLASGSVSAGEGACGAAGQCRRQAFRVPDPHHPRRTGPANQG